MNKRSKTPRTDAFLRGNPTESRWPDFARMLERELTRMERLELERHKEWEERWEKHTRRVGERHSR